MSIEKRLFVALSGALLIALAQAQAAQYSETVTIRPSHPTGGWRQALEPLDSANFTVKVIKKESGYQLKSGPDVSERWGTYGVIWTLSGSSDNSTEAVRSFSILNTSPYVEQSKVVVSCVWGPIPGGGGGGGTPLPDIYGWATGLVDLAVGNIEWSFQPESRLQAAHTNIVYSVWVANAQDDIVNTTFNFQVSSVNVNPYANWAIVPDSAAGPVLTGNVTANGGSRGNLRVDYSYFGYPRYAFSSNLTFVAIEKMQYLLGGAWSDVTDDPIYAAFGTNIAFRVYPKPSDTAWPTGKPVWTGAVATNDYASKTFTQTGTNLITAACGNTVTAAVVIITVVLKSVTFTSDHGQLIDYRVDYAGTEGPVYDPRGWCADPLTCNPITHVKDSKIAACVELCVQPASIQ